MGNCVGGFFKKRARVSSYWGRNKRVVLCFLGLDSAGKTTVVKALQGDDFGNVHPTVGFSRAAFTLHRCRITAYDLGGGERIRDIWPTYYAEVHGVVYVVDSAASSRLAENQQVIAGLDGREELLGKPILFLLIAHEHQNKKDLPEPIDEMAFSHRFDLHEMAKRNKADIRVEGVCAVKGTGRDMDRVIGEGVGWLLEKISDNYVSINKGVESALKELRAKQAQDRLERQHRMASNIEVPSESGGNEPPAVAGPTRPANADSAVSNGYAGLSDGEILRDEQTNAGAEQSDLRRQSTEDGEHADGGTAERLTSAKSAVNRTRIPLPEVQSVVARRHSRPTSSGLHRANREENEGVGGGSTADQFTFVKPYKPPSRQRERTNDEDGEEVKETQCL